MPKKKEIPVMAQYEVNGPWERHIVSVNLQDYINAKSPHIYIKSLVGLQSMGQEVISIDFKYPQSQAQKDLTED